MFCKETEEQLKTNLLSPEQVSKILGVTKVTLWRMGNREELGFPKKIKFCRKVFYKGQEVFDWIESRKEK